MSFTGNDLQRYNQCHPDLQRVLVEARQNVAFTILVSYRDRASQTAAKRTGHSKASYGQSAHNFLPALAVDLGPQPLDWGNQAAFVALKRVLFTAATAVQVPLTWGGDWDNEGTIGQHAPVDLDHFELRDWHVIARQQGLPS